MLQSWRRTGHLPCFFVPTQEDLTAQESPPPHEEPHKVPAQFPVIILPPISCMLGGVRLAVIDSDLHRGVETILNFATVCNMVKTILGGVNTCKYKSSAVFSTILRIGSAWSSHHCMEYIWVIFCRILVENFCVDSRSKSFPLEAIGIWKNDLNRSDRLGEFKLLFRKLEMASLPSPHWFKCEANSALDQWVYLATH